MKVLITGANGFIGSYLSCYLTAHDYNVVASAKSFHPSTKELLKTVELVQLDVLDTEQLKNTEIRADCIIHTATANDIVSRSTALGIELSTVGTKNILDFAVKNNIPRCIIFSTLQVYGTELTGDIDETSPLHYQNDYGLNHLYAELVAEMYTRQQKVACVAVRPSNVYGRILTQAFNRWSLVPGCFCKEALEAGTVTIKSSGLQMRNFVNLENLSRGIDAILQNFPKQFESYNLASSQGLTMKQMARIVKDVCERELNKKITINITGNEPAKTNHFNISLEKLKSIGFTEDHNYTPETEIREILKFLNAK